MSWWRNLQMIVTVVLLILAAACTLFEKEIEVPQLISLRMDRAADAPLQFSVLKDVNTASDETEKYEGDIAAYKITDITYSVTDFTGNNEPVISGNLEFAPYGSSNFIVLSTFEELNLEEMAASQAEKPLLLTDEAAKEVLTDLLSKGTTVTFRLNASTTNNPVAATLQVRIAANMTVEL